MPAKKVVVKVTSDVACPWCWVGKRAIEVAAANLNAKHPHAPIELELHWQPFQLDPELPSGTTANFLQKLAKIVGSAKVVEQWVVHPETMPMNRSCVASNLPNIEFRYSEKNVKFSTYRAHTLLTSTGPLQHRWDVQNKLKEAMLRMTHKEGKNLDRLEELTAAAKEAGVADNQEEVERILTNADVKALLDQELREARQLPHFSGVPYFVFSNGKTFSGGQPVEVFEAALTEVLASM